MRSQALEAMARQAGLSPAQLVDLVLRLRGDPVAWIEAATGKKLWGKQREIVRAFMRADTVNVPTANGVGKSFMAGTLVAYGANNVSPFLGLTTAPTDRQVREIIWKEVREIYAAQKLPLAGEPDMQQLKIAPNQRALGFATGEYNPNHFQGSREGSGETWVILDEACGVDPLVFSGVTSILGAGAGKCLLLGNPIDPTTIWREWCLDPDNTTIHISAYETPNFNIPGHELREEHFVAGTWRERLGPYWDPRAKDGKGDFKSLPAPYLVTPKLVAAKIKLGVTSTEYIAYVLGQFPDSSEQGLFGAAELDEARAKDLSAQAAEQPLEIGVDVAHHGNNVTVVCGWQDPVLRVLDAWTKCDTVETTARVVAIADRLARLGCPPLAVKVDAIGMGVGVYDQLRRVMVDWPGGRRPFPVVAFNSASTEGIPREPEEMNAAPPWLAQAVNHRGAAYLYLKHRAESRTLDLPPTGQEHSDQLRKELLAIRKENPDASAKTVVKGKGWMKANNISSPDFADAAVIAAFPGPRGSSSDFGITI